VVFEDLVAVAPFALTHSMPSMASFRSRRNSSNHMGVGSFPLMFPNVLNNSPAKQVMTRLAVFSIQSISHTTFKYGRFVNMTRGSLPLWHGQILEDSEAYVVFLRTNVNTNSGFFSFEKHDISMERNDIRKEANNTQSVDYTFLTSGLTSSPASLTKWVDGCNIWVARIGSCITSACAVRWA
jgi:hypothetical protein